MAARFLFLLQNLEVGGIQRQLLEVCRALVMRGDRVALAAFRSDDNAMSRAFEDAGVDVVHLNRRRRFDPGFVLRLRGLLRGSHFDLLHAMTPEAGMWAALLLPRSGPLLMGSVLNQYFFASRAACWLERQLTARRAGAIFVNSRGTASLYAVRISTRPRLAMLHNGVAAPVVGDRQQARAEMGLAGDAFAVLSIGRLAEVKGHCHAVRALALMRESGSNAHLVLVGEGPKRGEIESMTAALGLADRVHLQGECSEPEKLLAGADAFVLPSLSEGLPNALLEAMAAGLACVATEVGGIPEAARHEREALLVAPRDPEALASALLVLERSPQLRASLGAAARERVQRDFSLKAMLNQTLATYDALVKQHPSAHGQRRAEHAA